MSALSRLSSRSGQYGTRWDDGWRRGKNSEAAVAIPALAEGTAGVELASGFRKVAAVKPDALEPWAHGEVVPRGERPTQSETGREVETPLREGDEELDVLRFHGCRVGQWSAEEALHQVGDAATPFSLVSGDKLVPAIFC